METSEITISWECWPAAESLPWVTFITFIEILEAGSQAGGWGDDQRILSPPHSQLALRDIKLRV